MNFPFKETKEGPSKIRTFSSQIDSSELKWHWDEKDREVTILEDTDWEFQFDNELPIKLQKNMTIFIEEGRYHRVIKGKQQLKIKIEEF